MSNLRYLAPLVILSFAACLVFAQEDTSGADLLRQYKARKSNTADDAHVGIKVKTSQDDAAAEEEAQATGETTESEAEAEPRVGVLMGDAAPVFVGIVDHHALTRDTLQKRAEAQLGPQTKGLDDEEYRIELRKAEDAILREWAINTVLGGVAAAKGMKVTREEMSERLEELANAAGFPGEPEKALAVFGLKIRDYIPEMEQAILTEKLVFERLDQRLDEAFWRRLYETNKQQFYRPQRVHLRAIVRDLALTRRDDEVVAAIDGMNAAHKRIKRGGDFGEEAKALSDAPLSGANGGDMGWIGPGNQLAEPWDQKIFEMVPGRMSDVVMSDDGRYLYIFRVEEKEPEKYTPFEEARRELHFLVYDQAREEMYLDERGSFKILLNAGGLSDAQLAKVDRATLKYF